MYVIIASPPLGCISKVGADGEWHASEGNTEYSIPVTSAVEYERLVGLIKVLQQS